MVQIINTIKQELLAITQPQENEYPTINTLLNTSIADIVKIVAQESWINILTAKINKQD